MKKLMLLVAVFMLGTTGIAFAQEPVKKDKPATEQTEKKEEPKKEAQTPKKEEPKKDAKAEKPAAEKKAETPAQSAK